MAPRVVRMYASPSLEYVAAVLVVLRCGEAFLPLDPSWPEERVQSAGLASNTALLVSSGGLPAYNIAFPVLRLGNIWELSDDNLLSQIHRTRFSLLVFLLFFRLRCSWRLLVPLAGWLHTTLFVMRTLVGDVHFLSTLITPLQTRHVLDLTG